MGTLGEQRSISKPPKAKMRIAAKEPFPLHPLRGSAIVRGALSDGHPARLLHRLLRRAGCTAFWNFMAPDGSPNRFSDSFRHALDGRNPLLFP